jgi:predicted ATP-dependent endonuclease of OLD family
MIIEDSIRVTNYKCFDKEGGGFERILPINIIIGKNNSGKSSLIDLIQYLISSNEDFLQAARNNSLPEVIINHRLTDQEIKTVFHENSAGGDIPGSNHYLYGRNFINHLYTYKISPDLKQRQRKSFVKMDEPYVTKAGQYFARLANQIELPLTNKIFCNISAERDIAPESFSGAHTFSSNGSGSTNYIQYILNRTDMDSHLIENKLLKELNEIINPDIIFTRILVQLNPHDNWEIFFEDSNQNRIALSKMGSGIKTVLLVLLNLIVRPKIENKNEGDYVFAFEELENNLHPALQRRLYDYIKNYSEKHSAYFFLTTHSNVVIDAFSTYKNSQLIHVTNNDNTAKTTTVLSSNGAKNIIDDLGLKASDILQSNGIIWVEGPSDRNYLNKWISLVEPNIKEGLHYSIMFYGGRLLSNLSFDYEWLNETLIPLLKINTNAFVVIDRDGQRMSPKLNKTKNRIEKEVGPNNTWITKGREIENYLTSNSLQSWLKSKNITKTVSEEPNTKLEDIINYADNKLKYNRSKTVYSAEIVDHITEKSLDILDLRAQIEKLISVINEWNK